MNSNVIRLVAAVWLAAAFCLVPAARAQGPLTPPGAPAPMMKTLVQVEPRIPISSAAYTISQPGSYYLTTNLTCAGHGVVIAVGGVTLDLMGFTLTGDRGNSDYGVFLDGATNVSIRNVVVRNGIICNFGYGVGVQYTQNSRFEHLVVADNVNYGVYLNGSYLGQCDGNTIADCSISGNYMGINLNGSYLGQCDGNTVADCSVGGNSLYGVNLWGDNYGQCNGNTVADCAISENGSSGVWLEGYLGQCDGNAIVDCSVSGNREFGVYLYGSSGQCDGNTIAGCRIIGNGLYGIQLNAYNGQCDGNTISACAVQKNADRGISLWGADGNRLEGNHISGQTGISTYGILCSSTERNLLLRNTCVGQTYNFTMTANDTYGPIVTGAGALSTTNGAAGLSPWANFSR